MDVRDILLALLCVITVRLWWIHRELRDEVDIDHGYFDWWMRNLEIRKQDKPETRTENALDEDYEV